MRYVENLIFPHACWSSYKITFMSLQLNQLQTSSRFIVNRWNMTSLRVFDIFTIFFLQEVNAFVLFGRRKGNIFSCPDSSLLHNTYFCLSVMKDLTEIVAPLVVCLAKVTKYECYVWTTGGPFAYYGAYVAFPWNQFMPPLPFLTAP